MNQNNNTVVQKIRAQYTEREHTDLDTLRALHAKVKRPALIFALVFGIIGALVLGCGMSFALDAIEPGTYLGITVGETMMLPGVIIGVAGLLMVCVNYPIYKKILHARKKKYAARVLELSEKLMNR